MTSAAGSSNISGKRFRPRRAIEMASGIRDKVAILGMGCARFGERWNDDAEQLMVEAYVEAMADAGIEPSQIDAAWQSVGFDAMNVGPSGIPAAIALRLPNCAARKRVGEGKRVAVRVDLGGCRTI